MDQVDVSMAAAKAAVGQAQRNLEAALPK